MELQKTIDQAQTHLAKISDTKIEEIDFEWEGIRFHALTSETGAGMGKIRLSGKLGQLYYTIEDPLQRSLAIERVYSTNRGIDGTYRIDRDGGVQFNSVTATDKRLVGNNLISAVTLILLEAETHLRALKAHLKPMP